MSPSVTTQADCPFSAAVMYKTGDLGNGTSISKPKVDEGCSFASQLMRSWKSLGNAFPMRILVVNNCDGFRSRVTTHPWWYAVSHPQSEFPDIPQELPDDFYSLLKWTQRDIHHSGPESSGAHPETRSTRCLMKERAGSLQTLSVGIFLRRIHFSLDRFFATHLLQSTEMS